MYVCGDDNRKCNLQMNLDRIKKELDLINQKPFPKHLHETMQKDITRAFELHAAEHCIKVYKEELLKRLPVALHASLGVAEEGNEYEIKPEYKGAFWITHKGVGSGEPLTQWIRDEMKKVFATDDVKDEL